MWSKMTQRSTLQRWIVLTLIVMPIAYVEILLTEGSYVSFPSFVTFLLLPADVANFYGSTPVLGEILFAIFYAFCLVWFKNLYRSGSFKGIVESIVILFGFELFAFGAKPYVRACYKVICPHTFGMDLRLNLVGEGVVIFGALILPVIKSKRFAAAEPIGVTSQNET